MSVWGWIGLGWGLASIPAAFALGAVVRLANQRAIPATAPPRREPPILPQAQVDRLFREICAVSLHDIGTLR